MKNTKVIETQTDKHSDVEKIKEESDYLRGTLQKTLDDSISAGLPEIR